ncbi:MAG: nuclear transport factor 2 family protein [Ferruginibacter sp.]
MKSFLVTLLLLCLCLCSTAQADSSGNLQEESIQQETLMFNAIIHNDSAYLKKIISPDFVSINADGNRENKVVTLKNLSKFKGATYQISDRIIRSTNGITLIQGRAKFYFRSLLVADVYYTEAWHKSGNDWQYLSWQGTMTGWPAKYGVIVTVVSIIILWLIFRFVFRNRRKKTY